MEKHLLDTKKILKTVQILSQNELISKDERIEVTAKLSKLEISGLFNDFKKISSRDPLTKKFCKEAIDELERIIK